MKDIKGVIGFIYESNRIERISRPPTDAEVEEHYRLICLPRITVEDLQQFVSIYQPGAVLRDEPGMDLRIGGRVPMRGGARVRTELAYLLENALNISAYDLHVKYELLHPFTDGIGQSGRALWAWRTVECYELGFLHNFYYQALDAGHFKGSGAKNPRIGGS